MKSQVTLLHLNTEVLISKIKHVPTAAFLTQQDIDQEQPQKKIRVSMKGKQTRLPASTAHLRSPEAASDEKATHILVPQIHSKAGTRFVG